MAAVLNEAALSPQPGAPNSLVLRAQEKQYQALLKLMGRPSFVALVAGPPGCGKKTLVRRAARERGLAPHDFDIEASWSEPELRRRVSMLSPRVLGDDRDAAWLVFNAELVDARAAVWKSSAAQGQRMTLLVNDASPGLRRELAPLYFNRLTDYTVAETLRATCPTSDTRAVARRAMGDLRQASIIASFSQGSRGKDTGEHVYFDTKALLNGGPVDADKVSAAWAFENALNGCEDLAAAAQQAEFFVTAATLDDVSLQQSIVHGAARRVKRKFVQELERPRQVCAGDALSKRCRSHYGAPRAMLGEHNPHPQNHQRRRRVARALRGQASARRGGRRGREPRKRPQDGRRGRGPRKRPQDGRCCGCTARARGAKSTQRPSPSLPRPLPLPRAGRAQARVFRAASPLL